ncbi:MAG TPA: undecaprenyl-phosphate glucose phosphotransferase [Lachnospiraceae bacterium]|nr:undecaprenyl-phosphate glucose phosphotransferase [Lachnospiraceae bacterium]
MIEENEKFYYRFLAVVDAVVLCISYWLAWYSRYRSTLLFSTSFEAVPYRVYMRALYIMVPAMLILYSACNLYTSNRVKGRRLEIASIIQANVIGALIFMSALQLLHQTYWSRWLLFLFFCYNVTLDTAARFLLWNILKRFRRKGMNQRSVLLVGYSRAAEEYIDRVTQNPQWGYIIRGILDDRIEAGTMYKGIKVIGRIDNLMIILPENHLDEIAITLGLKEYARLEEIVALCEKSGVHTKFIPDYNNIIPTKPYTEDIMGMPVINIRYVPLSNTFRAAEKRLVDIVGSIVAIILAMPVMIIFSIIIKATSPGPLIFKQERVGLHNRKFMMYKFRSMVVQEEKDEKKAWTVRDDPRVTKVGKIMRKTSIDELPQLFNVLKGEMSMVGPRPERPFYVEKFQEEIPRYMVKHQVRPGMTGWAQIHGYRGDTSIRKRIEYDLYYIENWTLGLDIKILFLTIFRGFVNNNAY